MSSIGLQKQNRGKQKPAKIAQKVSLFKFEYWRFRSGGQPFGFGETRSSFTRSLA